MKNQTVDYTKGILSIQEGYMETWEWLNACKYIEENPGLGEAIGVDLSGWERYETIPNDNIAQYVGIRSAARGGDFWEGASLVSSVNAPKRKSL